jgi:hypothetical protein
LSLHIHHFPRQGKKKKRKRLEKKATVKEINTEIRENTCMGKRRNKRERVTVREGDRKGFVASVSAAFDGVSFL